MKRAIIVPPAKCLLKGVYLQADDGHTSNAGLVTSQGIQTSVAKKPFFMLFFRGGGGGQDHL